MFPRRGYGYWFPQAYMPRRGFQRGCWNMSQPNCFPIRPGPDWVQFRPMNQRAYDDSFDNCRGPYRGRGWRRFQGHFCRYRDASRSPCLVGITPNKKENKSKKMETHSTTFKETEKGKKDPTSPVQKTDSPKVSQMATKTVMSPSEFSFLLPDSSTYPQNKEEVSPEKKEEYKVQSENSQTAEVSPNRTSPLPSAEAPAEEATLSNITEGPTEEPLLNSLQRKDRDSKAKEYCANQTHPSPPPEEPVEEQTASETTEDHSIAKENSLLLEVKPSTEHFGRVSSHVAVEIPFLCEATNDHQSEEKEAIELVTPSTDRCEDASHEQKDAAVTVDVCSLPCTLSDIRSVPVLVRATETKLPYPWEADSLLAETLRGWAPEDCQEPPWGVNEADKCEKVSECGRGSVPYQSLPQTHISCDQKCDIEKPLDCHSCSPKSHHSSASKHSSQNCDRELCILSSGSPHRREKRSRSPDKEKKRLKSPHRQEQRLRSPHRKKQRLRSPHRREQRSRSSHRHKQSPHGREQSSDSPQRRRNDFGRCYYCYCDRKHSCSLSQENSLKRDLSPHSLPCKKPCHHSPKEKSKMCKVTHLCSPVSHTVKAKGKKVMQPEKSAKKKRTSSEKGTKSVKGKSRNSPTPVSHAQTSILLEAAQNLHLAKTESEIQMAASSEDTGSPHHPNADEETSSSAVAWTLKDRSAAVLARKEEIEEAYLRVVLNFAGVAIMLVKEEPGILDAVDSALRANLRKIGDYYEHMLESYIDSLAEAS